MGKVKKNKKNRRSWEEIDKEILKVLRISERSISTKKVAELCNLDHRSALNHLKQLEFDDFIFNHKRGILGRVIYWKIRR